GCSTTATSRSPSRQTTTRLPATAPRLIERVPARLTRLRWGAECCYNVSVLVCRLFGDRLVFDIVYPSVASRAPSATRRPHCSNSSPLGMGSFVSAPRGGQGPAPALRCAAGRAPGIPLGREPMAKNKKLLILAGDGIGPEVMRQVARVLDWFAKRRA